MEGKGLPGWDMCQKRTVGRTFWGLWVGHSCGRLLGESTLMSRVSCQSLSLNPKRTRGSCILLLVVTKYSCMSPHPVKLMMKPVVVTLIRMIIMSILWQGCHAQAQAQALLKGLRGCLALMQTMHTHSHCYLLLVGTIDSCCCTALSQPQRHAQVNPLNAA